MATELNLNTLNWVTLACPDCAAEVQVLEDDVQLAGSIRCPGCGEVIAGGEAENEPASAVVQAEAPPRNKAAPSKTDDVTGEKARLASSETEASKAVPDSEAVSPDGVNQLLAGLPDSENSGENSGSATPPGVPEVEPSEVEPSEIEPSEIEAAQVTDDSPSKPTLPAPETERDDEEFDEGGLTQDASKDETVVSESGPDGALEQPSSPALPPLPDTADDAAELELPVLELAEETEDEDAEAEPATKLQRLSTWLQTRRRQLTGTAVSVAVHLVMLGVLALIVFQIRKIDESSAIDGRIGSKASEAELRNLEEIPAEEVKIDPTPNRIDVSRITRQQTDQSVQLGEGELPELSFEGPNGLLQTLTADPKWQTPMGQGLEGRTALNRAQLAMLHGGSEKSESAVEDGLKWLLRHQRPNGSWSFRHKLPTCTTRCLNSGRYDCPTGATGLSLLCFLGAGYTHREGPYQEEVGKALAWLVEQSCMGELQYDLSRESPEGSTGFYAQGMASIALCEAYGMTKDPALREPAQDALDFISRAQDPLQGGWRYEINQRGDTSVVGWQVMALVSGRMADLDVARSTRSKVLNFLTHVRSPTGDFGYTGRYRFTLATTSIGVLCTMYLDPLTARRSLRGKIKKLARTTPLRENLYSNYYISQVLHHFGGDEWTRWNSKMRNSLVSSQLSGGHGQGSWFSNRNYGQGGRLYSTCMSILILEVYYRHLPLYQQDATLLKIPEVQATD